jgi:hypothetical protein
VADDPLSAALAEIRKQSRWTSSARGIAAPGATAVKSAEDVPRLLAALDVALTAIGSATGTLDPEKTRADVLAALTGKGKADG